MRNHPAICFLFYANIATIVNYASAVTFVSLFSFFAAAFRQASSSIQVGVPGLRLSTLRNRF